MCYAATVLTLGLTLISVLIHGLTLTKDTVSQNMITYTSYRIVISTCIILQLGFWAVCLYSKQNIDPKTAAWGFLCLGLTACSWIGLSTILSGELHYIFVCVFITFFFVFLLILCNLSRQRIAVEVLVTAIGLILVSIVVMIILFNNREFYIMEHVAFLTYSLVFLVFFLVHRSAEWDKCDELDAL